MPDYGLLGGLAEGITKGFQSYRDTKKEAFDQAIKQKLMERQESQDARDTYKLGLEEFDKTGVATPSLLSARNKVFPGEQSPGGTSAPVIASMDRSSDPSLSEEPQNPADKAEGLIPQGLVQDKGLIKPPDQNNPFAGGVNKRAAERARLDPTSSYSKNAQDLAIAGLNKASPGYGDKMEKQIRSMSAEDVNKNPIIEKVITGGFGAQTAAVRASGFTQGNDIKRDEQANKAANEIHKDKAVVTAANQIRSIDKGLRVLSEPGASPQQVNDAMMDFGKAIAGGGNLTDSKMRALGVPNLKNQFAEWMQKYTSDPNQAAPPELVEYAKKFGKTISDINGDQLKAAAINAGKGKNYKHNPDAQQAIKEAQDSYLSGKWKESGDVEAAPATQEQDPKISGYAKQFGLDYAHAKEILNKRGYNGE